MKVLEKIVLRGVYDEIEEISKDVNHLINEMLQVEPKKRININIILKHTIYKKFKFIYWKWKNIII